MNHFNTFLKVPLYIYVSTKESPIGRSSIRNYGIGKSDGDVIQLFDDSIVLHKEYLLEMLIRFEHLNGQKIAVVGFKERLSADRKITNLITKLLGSEYFIPDAKNDWKQYEEVLDLLERENDYYSSEEIKNFFSQEMQQSHRIAFKALFLTGMRFGELSNLTWERIDWINKIIQIRSDESFRTKTKSSERDIPMSDKLFSIVEGLKENSTTEFVFCSTSNNKLSERTLLSVCKVVADKAGIKKNATLHKFRHSFNSHLAQLGADYSVRQYLMGHKPQTMTDHQD